MNKKKALRSLGLSIVLLGLFFSASAYAGYCDNSTVRSISRPILREDPKLGTFQYKFSHQKRENPNATVLIFLPGGPGQASMDMALSLPNTFAVVRTDPRGVGCNKREFPAESFSSAELAQDIVAIIKEIKPKRYILHGISYGTVAATHIAAALQKESLVQPLAVVLEGTVGKHYEPGEYSAGYIKAWEKLLTELPTSVSSQFRGQLKGSVLPLGFSSLEWASWISSMSIYGKTPAGKDLLKDALMLLEPGREPKLQRSLSAQLSRSRVLPSAERVLLYREIICRELVPDTVDLKYDFDLQAGKLVRRAISFCDGTPASRLYDSADYQIPVPVYYFSGQLDPATPSSQARYHFSNQKTPNKFFVHLPEGGHQALSFNLFDCSIPIWLAIEQNETPGPQTALKTALTQCRQPSILTSPPTSPHP